MGKPSTPQPPDYAAAAREQGTANLQTAIANQVLGQTTQETPYGRISYEQTGQTQLPATWGTDAYGRPVQTPGTAIPSYTSRVELSPEVQQLVDADLQQRIGLAGLSNEQMPRVSNALAQPFDVSSDAARQRVEDALYQRHTRYLDPQWAQAENLERARLANQGFSTGVRENQNTGFGDAMSNFYASRDRAYGAARDDAIARGLTERQQAIQEQLLQRTQPLTELNALRTGAAPTLPSFAGAGMGNAAPPPVFGAAQAQAGAANDIYNAEAGNYNSQMQGLYGLGAAGITALAFM